MSAEETARMLDGMELSRLRRARLHEELDEDGLVIVHLGLDGVIELHGSIEAEAPPETFGVMANGDIRHRDERADCLVSVMRSEDHPGVVEIGTTLPDAAFAVMNEGELFCRGTVFEHGDLLRRGGVVFDGLPAKIGPVYYRGILLQREADFTTARRLAAERRVPLLCGPIRRRAGPAG